MTSQFIFLCLLIIAIVAFLKNARRIYNNITLGRAVNRTDKAMQRIRVMFLTAFGQKKMFKKPIPALLHLLVYLGFCIINIEMLEIIIDGVFGTHRIFSQMGNFYNLLIFCFEVLALLVLVSCIIFLLRRNFVQILRFRSPELKNWPKTDANLILVIEILLMAAFLIMNGADFKLQQLNISGYQAAGSFPISSMLFNLLPSNATSIIVIERAAWWFHILGVLAFLNYLPYSKHLHIILAFPNTYFSQLTVKGKFANMRSVTNEVKYMLDPSTPPASGEVERFGAKDIRDLTWKNLLDAYTCTECGRCSASCPATMTGKLLSPRKIMMDTRDRMEEIGKHIQKHSGQHDDGKSLLDGYITREEIWACTSCNACVEQCPVNINPLEIILSLRQYSVLEESSAPTSINMMFNNLENNGAPWKYAQADRANWANK